MGPKTFLKRYAWLRMSGAVLCLVAGCANQESKTAVENPGRIVSETKLSETAKGSEDRVDMQAKSPDRGNTPTATDRRPADARPSPSPDAGKQAVHEERWANDKLKLREEYIINEDGEEILHGMTAWWWENGNPRLELEYKNGFPDGAKRAWFENGNKHSEGFYVDGKEHGTWTSYYPNGQKEHEFHMNHGAFHGTDTRWHPDGKKSTYVEWRNGKQIGFFTRWDEEGNILQEIDYGNPSP